MPSEHSTHPLARRITEYGQFAYPVADNIDTCLGILYEGKLYETLCAGYPGREIVLNLTHAYGLISHEIFWTENDTYKEALDALPVLADHIAETELGLGDLYNVSKIVENFHDWDPVEHGPAHLTRLNQTIISLTALFDRTAYRDAIYEALKDKSRSEFSELISMANWFYGEDEFDLFFSFAEVQPVEALDSAHWLIGISDPQRETFITWARDHMPSSLSLSEGARTQDYDETVTQILDRVIWQEEHILKAAQDRLDFTVWGLCSANKFMAADAAYLLEDLPVSQWPEGSQAIIAKLYEEMEPNWTSFKSKGGKGHYTTHKERLGSLLEKANQPS